MNKNAIPGVLGDAELNLSTQGAYGICEIPVRSGTSHSASNDEKLLRAIHADQGKVVLGFHAFHELRRQNRPNLRCRDSGVERYRDSNAMARKSDRIQFRSKCGTARGPK
jgi:hypothetical protein